MRKNEAIAPCFSFNALFSVSYAGDFSFITYCIKLVSFSGTTLVNLAEGKPAAQMQTVSHASASRAVDGDRTSKFGAGSCTHTPNPLTSPWWRVDLQNVVGIY